MITFEQIYDYFCILIKYLYLQPRPARPTTYIKLLGLIAIGIITEYKIALSLLVTHYEILIFKNGYKIKKPNQT